MKLNFLRLFDKPLKRFYFQTSFFNILALFLAIYRSLFLGFFLAKMKKWYENSIGCIFSTYFFHRNVSYMGQGIQWTKENLWKTAFKKIEVIWYAIWYAIPLQFFFHLNFFKGCLPQILLCPFLNNLTHIILYQLAK